MSYKLNTPETKEIEILRKESFSASSVTILNFSFNEESECMAFLVEWKNAENSDTYRKEFNLGSVEFRTLISANVAAMQAMRAAIFSHLQTTNELGAGSDTWPAKG
jgi:hypothetical protein